MEHPFKIGETYKNNKGQYTVLEISPPTMLIQYASGSFDTVTIELQARIWDRIQTEQTTSKEAQAKQTSVKKFKNTFQGLQESDFKDNVADTTWRSRQGLGGLVTRNLSDLNGREFTSWSIYRRPVFFVYDPRLPMFNQDEGVRLPKFLVRLSSDFLYYGFYIEKSDKVMGSDWYWPRFLDMLSIPPVQRQFQQIIAEQAMWWELHFSGKGVPRSESITFETIVDPLLVGNTKVLSFPEFLIHLKNLPADEWCDLYLGRYIAKTEAIEMGTRISQVISKAFNALAPMYWKLVRGIWYDGQ